MEKVAPNPTTTGLDIDPALLGLPGMAEYASPVAPEDALKAGLETVMPFQHLESLAVDPSQSQEEQAKVTEELFRAVGKVSLAAETLNNEDVQMKARIYQARTDIANVQAQQHQQSMDILNPFDTRSKADKDVRDRTAELVEPLLK
jgi:hypothetical protein